MGTLKIETEGSFKKTGITFSATDHGHAQAVASAIKFLSSVILPEAIAQDHELQSDNYFPNKGFRKE